MSIRSNAVTSFSAHLGLSGFLLAFTLGVSLLSAVDPFLRASGVSDCFLNLSRDGLEVAVELGGFVGGHC